MKNSPHFPIILVLIFVVTSGLWLAGLSPQNRVAQRAAGPNANASQQIVPPALRFSTYLGGSDTDTGSAIAIDGAGYIYIAGQTASRDFPTRNAILTYQGGTLADTDVFIAKFNPKGDSLVYATYLGGSGDELATALVVDDAGRVIVAGSTTSSDFPTNQTLHAYRGGQVLQSDAFIARLHADGSGVDFATYLGGTSEETITALALGPDGSLYAAGSTMSVDFPVTPGAFQETHAGGGLLRADAFLTRLDPEGSGFRQTYTTYLGGRVDEVLSGIAVDEAGRAYVTGFTNSPDFPTQNALQPAYAGPMRDGEGDAFITRLNPEGDRLDFSSYLGSTEDDQATSLVLRPDGTVYLTGWTQSHDFPATPDALQPELRGTRDVFVARLVFSSSGNLELTYATFLGGSGEDAAYGLAVGPDAAIWISGATDAAAFPLAAPIQPVPGGGITEAFIAHFTAGADTLAMATYLGGSQDEGISRLALGPNATTCITGTTGSTDFLVLRAWKPTSPGGPSSAFVSCFGEPPAPVASENREEIPAMFALHANYPNPFNPTTVIPFSLAQQSDVVIEVFDVTGRRVATLLNHTYPPGHHETRFDARGLASGIYLYRIRAGDFQATRSFVLVR